ncbi:hypothetical protein [Maritimibacter sp. UBA3975]|uniref:hypothetical protein n=1 Tax=Maritimibacter sp. UBA3975 TaxID=1946833 RepID=UPI000C099ACA|nr:hypothetical protein [Maritimibacter sp. UBA3975]MAM61695.1 hypothetical protein [Maritimibacter sp.]|tara:strand:- start:4409 stop:4996 length:588 start_codon:yes stop_codon:yes gene_type:complete
MIRAAVTLALILPFAPARAQEAIPTFQTCMDILIDRYEQSLIVNGHLPIDDVVGGLWSSGDVYTCGGGGIVLCDRSGDTIPCQKDLAAEQDAMTARILGDLPDPGTLDEGGEDWPRALYAQTRALAEGTSAGPDCAGTTELMGAWCGANEANARLRIAVLAWQIARYLGAAPSGVESGWVDRPPPVRPRSRPKGP